MNDANLLRSRVAECNAESERCADIAEVKAQQIVGQDAGSMSDAERELHIRNCGYLMEDAMQRYYETGDFGYRGEADRWRLLMEEAIKARTAGYVARLEAERGLSGR